MRALHLIEQDIEQWISSSAAGFKPFVENDRIWVLKFIDVRFLGGFLAKRSLAISATPGFTWGDGIYASPLANAHSMMMYGRAGVMGYLDAADVPRVYDAADPRGVALYQEWIQYSPYWYRLLTTTVHADLANRFLRNSFRKAFDIGLVFFPPDQMNSVYVDRKRDRWFLISDWLATGPQAPGQKPTFSSRVRDCRWVAVVGEQFDPSTWKTHYTDLIGPYLHAGKVRTRPNLRTDLMKAWTANQPYLIQP
jgi:hypothetical protein